MFWDHLGLRKGRRRLGLSEGGETETDAAAAPRGLLIIDVQANIPSSLFHHLYPSSLSIINSFFLENI